MRVATPALCVLGVAGALACPPASPRRVGPFSTAKTAEDSARVQDELDRRWPEYDLSAEPPRPRLPGADPDTNDAAAYYSYGFAEVYRAPRDAARAFYWAARIEPTMAEAYYARWAVLRQHADVRRLPNGHWDFSPLPPADRARLDSLMYLAMVQNPFVDNRLDFRPIAPHPEGARILSRDPALGGFEAYAQRDFATAARLWAKALRKHPKALGLHIERARAFYFLAQRDSAIAELSTLIEKLNRIQREDSLGVYISKEMLYYAIGMLQAQQDREAAARDAYQRALTENLGFYMAHARLAGVALATGDTATAVGELETAVTIKPDDPALRMYYGYVLFRARRPADAAEQLRDAIRLDPYYAAPYEILGKVVDLQGQSVTAATLYANFLARASRRDPERAWVIRRLAKLQEAAGAAGAAGAPGAASPPDSASPPEGRRPT